MGPRTQILMIPGANCLENGPQSSDFDDSRCKLYRILWFLSIFEVPAAQKQQETSILIEHRNLKSLVKLLIFIFETKSRW